MTPASRRLGVAATVLAIGIGAVAVARAVSSGPSGSCSIDTMAAEYGLVLNATSDTAAGRSQAITDLQVQYPGSTVIDQRVASIASARLPTVDGHVALILLLGGVQAAMPGGTPSSDGSGVKASSNSVVACAAAIYDAQSGAFLVGFRDMGTSK